MTPPRDVLSPELSDGHHQTVTEHRAMVLAAIGTWMDEFHDTPGESFTVSVARMTQAELDKLPEI